jgi:hypothetical protein
MRRLFKGRRKAFAIPVLALLVPALAWAAWTILNVQGQGGAKGGTIVAPSILAGQDAAAVRLTPGNVGDLVLAISNPNAPLVLTRVAQGAGSNSSDEPGCAATNVSVVTKTGLSLPVPSGSSTIIVPGGASMLSSAPDACKAPTAFSFSIVADFSTP